MDHQAAAPRQLASAIVPAYNEAPRIARVLDCLIKVPSLNEIIVVDDGSADHLEQAVGAYPGVTYLRNPVNQGKSAALDLGVRQAANDVLLFCDADLIHLRPEDVECIIQHVATNELDMFVGVRNSEFNKQVAKQKRIPRLFFISGLRALKRPRWEKLPAFYKKRFRIEIGLTYYTSRYGAGWGYGFFDYAQSNKEVKHGVVTGFALRLWMISDLVFAYLVAKTIGEILYQAKRLLGLKTAD
jgi:glycosyltransferase involved in cell wall biosynthesis